MLLRPGSAPHTEETCDPSIASASTLDVSAPGGPLALPRVIAPAGSTAAAGAVGAAGAAGSSAGGGAGGAAVGSAPPPAGVGSEG